MFVKGGVETERESGRITGTAAARTRLPESRTEKHFFLHCVLLILDRQRKEQRRSRPNVETVRRSLLLWYYCDPLGDHCSEDAAKAARNQPESALSRGGDNKLKRVT